MLSKEMKKKISTALAIVLLTTTISSSVEFSINGNKVILGSKTVKAEENTPKLIPKKKATNAVIEAETSKTKSLVLIDKNLVNALEYSQVKEELTAEEEAINLVVKAETTRRRSDLALAKKLVHALTDEALKEKLITRLNVISTIEDEWEKLEIDAEAAVTKAEKTELQEDIDAAFNLVNQLEDGPLGFKSRLIERLNVILAETDSIETIRRLESQIYECEQLRIQGVINLTKKAVNSLKEQKNIDALTARLDVIEPITDNEEIDRIGNAHLAIKIASDIALKENIDKAKELSNLVKDEKAKTYLIKYISNIKEIQQNALVLELAKLDTNRAIATRKHSDKLKALASVDKLFNSSIKTQLLDKLSKMLSIQEEYEQREMQVDNLIEVAYETKTEEDFNKAKEAYYKLPKEYRLLNDKNYRLDILEIILKLK